MKKLFIGIVCIFLANLVYSQDTINLPSNVYNQVYKVGNDIIPLSKKAKILYQDDDIEIYEMVYLDEEVLWVNENLRTIFTVRYQTLKSIEYKYNMGQNISEGNIKVSDENTVRTEIDQSKWGGTISVYVNKKLVSKTEF